MTDQLYYGKNKDKIKCVVLINMDKDGKITDEQYNKYFKQKNSTEDIKEIIKNNKFFINGFPIPGTESEFKNKTPEDVFNQRINILKSSRDVRFKEEIEILKNKYKNKFEEKSKELISSTEEKKKNILENFQNHQYEIEDNIIKKIIQGV